MFVEPLAKRPGASNTCGIHLFILPYAAVFRARQKADLVGTWLAGGVSDDSDAKIGRTVAQRSRE